MKKLVLSLAFFGVVQFASAQDTFKTDVLEIVKNSEMVIQMNIALEQMENILSKDKKVEFKKDLDANLPDYYNKLASIYMKYYTAEDVKKIMEFYNTPLGKKIKESTAKIVEENIDATQEWGMGIEHLMMKYM